MDLDEPLVQWSSKHQFLNIILCLRETSPCQLTDLITPGTYPSKVFHRLRILFLRPVLQLLQDEIKVVSIKKITKLYLDLTMLIKIV